MSSFAFKKVSCLSSFLEAFQKISDIAETNNAGLRPFGIALRRYCLRQRCVESRLRSFNSQITECLVTPLSDRLDEWRRTANQMDRDCVKELRKAKSELQRAILEAEKCKKRLRRKSAIGLEFSSMNIHTAHDVVVVVVVGGGGGGGVGGDVLTTRASVTETEEGNVSF
ncbi:Protein MTSS 1 [Taenia solium]|eukprot:TsM_001126700 transcript=TsM_001126700 gene=TsM_001126700